MLKIGWKLFTSIKVTKTKQLKTNALKKANSKLLFIKKSRYFVTTIMIVHLSNTT